MVDSKKIQPAKDTGKKVQKAKETPRSYMKPTKDPGFAQNDPSIYLPKNE